MAQSVVFAEVCSLLVSLSHLCLFCEFGSSAQSHSQTVQYTVAISALIIVVHKATSYTPAGISTANKQPFCILAVRFWVFPPAPHDTQVASVPRRQRHSGQHAWHNPQQRRLQHTETSDVGDSLLQDPCSRLLSRAHMRLMNAWSCTQ